MMHGVEGAQMKRAALEIAMRSSLSIDTVRAVAIQTRTKSERPNSMILSRALDARRHRPHGSHTCTPPAIAANMLGCDCVKADHPTKHHLIRDSISPSTRLRILSAFAKTAYLLLDAVASITIFSQFELRR
jgi:hypothetical protein